MVAGPARTCKGKLDACKPRFRAGDTPATTAEAAMVVDICALPLRGLFRVAFALLTRDRLHLDSLVSHPHPRLREKRRPQSKNRGCDLLRPRSGCLRWPSPTSRRARRERRE